MELGQGGCLAVFLSFGAMANACLLLAELCVAYPVTICKPHAGRCAEFALKFRSFRTIIGRLTRCPPLCLETLVVVRMSSQKL